MPELTRILFLILFTGISINLFPQACLTGKNQFDSGGKKHGYWLEVSKLHPEIKIFKGWYKHGKETKRCTYYNYGLKLMKIKYLNDSLMRVRRYDSLGNLEYKGMALWLTNAGEMRYCWDGEFTFYDLHKHKIKTVLYKRGVEQDLD